jgi:hypothetical protein
MVGNGALSTSCTPAERLTGYPYIEYIFLSHPVMFILSAILLTPLAGRNNETNRTTLAR